MPSLYPEIEPYRSGHLPVDSPHSLYWEESGNPEGIPVVFLHGGPGGGTLPKHRQYFDPKRYRIVLFDQRGCGKSLPFSSLEKNTTWELVADIEALRRFLGIEKWVVFGGSWGSTLGLCYAIHHPERVVKLILRGIYLGRQSDSEWYCQSGARNIYPDAWESFLAPIPEEERGEMIRAYYKRLTSADPAVRQTATRAWAGWEATLMRLEFDPELFAAFTSDAHADSIARIECHYLINRLFFDTDQWILQNVRAIQQIPGVIIHGRYDMICPLVNAWDLHRAWPRSQIEIVRSAGHSASEPGILDALIRATDAPL